MMGCDGFGLSACSLTISGRLVSMNRSPVPCLHALFEPISSSPRMMTNQKEYNCIHFVNFDAEAESLNSSEITWDQFINGTVTEKKHSAHGKLIQTLIDEVNIILIIITIILCTIYVTPQLYSKMGSCRGRQLWSFIA